MDEFTDNETGSGSKRSVLSALAQFLSPTDDQLMWRVQMHDDAQAFAELVGRWEAPIRRLCARMLGDVHRAEDLAQETFSRIYARRKEYKAEAKFSTYLWRVALNLCYDELRRVRRRAESSLDDEANDCGETIGPSLDFAPGAALLREERAQIVRDALMQLPETLRAVVVLRHYENLKFREVAGVLGIPEGTVKSRMVEALSQLHRTLTRALGQTSASSRGQESNRASNGGSGLQIRAFVSRGAALALWTTSAAHFCVNPISFL